MKNLVKAALLGILIGSQAVAGLPPTSSKDSDDTSPTTTFTFEFPHFTGTHTGTIFSLGVNGVAGGGTGISTVPSNGYLLIGNGLDYTAAALTPGSGISVTNGSGSVTIAETFPMPSPSPSGNYLTANGTNWVSSTGPTIYTDNGANTYLSTNLIVSNNLATQINNSGQQARLEIGNNNLLIDPSFETSSLGAWSKGSGVSVITETSYFVDGGQAAELSLSSVTAGETLWYQDVTPGQPLNAVNGLASLWIYSTQANNLEVCPRSGGTTITTACTPLTTASVWSNLPANFIFPSTGSVGVALVAVNNIASGTAYVDSGYLGLATNLAQTSQAQLIGQVKITGCSSAWSTTSTSFAAFSAQSNCVYTVTPGTQGTAPGTNVPGITFASLPPGNYVLKYEGAILNNYVSSANTAYFQFSDGTNTANDVSTVAGTSSSSTELAIPGLQQTISYSTAQSNITLQIKGMISASGSNAQIYGVTALPGVISVYYYPTQTQLTYAANLPTQPQVTTYASSSGTYTVPVGATRIEVELIGGGGGGNAGGVSAGTGSAGNNTTFGSSLLTGDGGGAGSGTDGGTGGSASCGSASICQAYQGGYGGAGSGYVSSAGIVDVTGGSGAASPFGGAGGGGGANGAGTNAIANTGSGGGGGAPSGEYVNSFGGGGGGAGGYVHAVITSNSSAWATSYAWAVGSGGAGGTTGTDEDNGGNGANGQIIVTAYFGNQPIQFVGQVSSNTSGQIKDEAATVVCSSSASVSSQSGSWISSIANISSYGCALTIASGEFSATPYACTGGIQGSSAATTVLTFEMTSATSITVFGSGTPSSFTAGIHCYGPR